MEKLNKLGNIEIDDVNGFAVFSINPEIYPLELVYSAAYIMIDKAFIILDGDPDKEILVEIRKKTEDQNLNELVREFNEELLNYATYKTQTEKNKGIREMILQRVLLTNDPNYFLAQQQTKEEEIDDPKGIMKTWWEENPEKAEKDVVNNCSQKRENGKSC